MSVEAVQTLAHLSGAHWVDYAAFLVPTATVLVTIFLARRLEKDGDGNGDEGVEKRR